MKKTLTISALALTVATLGAVAGQAQVASGPARSEQAQEVSWRGGEGGWRKGRDGRGGEGQFGRHGRQGGHHARGGHGAPRGGDMMRRLQAFDANNDGAITQSEVDQFRQGQITRFDANSDGMLSLDEYQAFWLERMRERMVDAFQQHDDDGNGRVTPEEFNERFARLVERLDRNGDGQLDNGDRRGKRRPLPQEAPLQPAGDAAPGTSTDANSAPTPAQ